MKPFSDTIEMSDTTKHLDNITGCTFGLVQHPYPSRGGGRGGDKTNLSHSIFFYLEILG